MTPVVFAPAAFKKGLIRLCAALCAAVLAVSLLPQLSTRAEAAEISPRITPPQGQTAVQAGDRVTVSGSAPAGEVQGGTWLGVDEDGDQVTTALAPGSYNMANDSVRLGVVGVTSAAFVRNDSGKLVGQLDVPAEFSDPNTEAEGQGAAPCVDECVRTAAIVLTVAGANGTSNALRVDFTRPRIERYDVVGVDLVRVVFSEPVQLRSGQVELPSTWSVTQPSRSIASVQGPTENDCQFSTNADASAGTTGCTRTLKLGQAVGEDETPTLEYTNSGSAIPNNTPHVDGAGSRLIGVIGVKKVSLDVVRPAAPEIESVDAKTPSTAGEVISGETNPVVVLNNVTAGHDVEVTALRGTDPVATSTVAVPTGASQVTTTLALPGDGDYLIKAVAIDDAGNRSDQADKNGPRADGRATVTYLIDGVAPILMAAKRISTTVIDVAFTEPVTPADEAGIWRIGDVPVTTVTGSGAVRRLETEVPTDSNTLTWTGGLDGTRYKDKAGNAVADFVKPLNGLSPLATPGLTTPTRGAHTKASTVRIAGTAPSGANLQAQLFERGAEEPTATAPVSGGTWEFAAQPLKDNTRNRFEVRLFNTVTEVFSARRAVPDLVRDSTAPVVEVSAPSGPALPGGAPAEYNVGQTVTVKWVATDTAASDTRFPDHGRVANVFLVTPGGERRIGENLSYTAGKEQSFQYTLRATDLGGKGLRDLSFRVAVTDYAGNVGTDPSGAIRLLGPRITFTPVLTAAGILEVRFGEALQGTMLPNDWQADGKVVAAEQPKLRNGNTVVVLRTPADTDPNSTPKVAFAPALSPTARMRSANDSQISQSPRTALDRVAPALSVTVPDTAAVVDRNSVTFTGTTDKSTKANTVRAYRSDAAGNRVGSSIAKATAKADGSWSLAAPLVRNARNRIVVRATDPSSNASATKPSSPYTVVEDSRAPVVTGLRPVRGSKVGPSTRIRWATSELYKRSAALSYRPDGGSWTRIARATADDGSYGWSVPMTLKGKTFALRVTAVDTTGKTDSVTSSGLRLDAVAPKLAAAKTIAENKVRLVFSEKVSNIRRGDFTVDGRGVRKVTGTGATRTLVLYKVMRRTTPTVEYTGGPASDTVGNQLRATERTAQRGFVFSVTNFDADRLSARKARLTWTDVRNRASHVRGYRIYRDGDAIATTGWSARSFVDGKARGTHRYTIRAIDTAGRSSAASKVTLR